MRRSPASNTPTGGLTPPHSVNSTASPAVLPPTSIFDLESPRAFDESNIGSPLKKQRASVTGLDDEAMKRRLGLGLSDLTEDSLAQIDAAPVKVEQDPVQIKVEQDPVHVQMKQDQLHHDMTMTPGPVLEETQKHVMSDEEL